ncbi:MAG: hypothetical protein A3D67_01245 [Candidatus Lloydbacteria bacterium RIFCSPHIGHO2_02_FULL_51_22]|uniref:Uncharacterized protein n=2 Tax=Candidatus Lloydiibacteriota TaxID=1817910 RepID=A0A1G2D8N3_9BACT|nr:MAG: hypothetical protein A3D67_01245 [Candidatus Lloydbacteria bacterium RIFCSPHIGHO2_02_FULL_51_22]OGZ15851.1 MAG: hypothetical protein A3J08_03520 [Candidatus Lloydbacteria bacterium RIFCSPLOWO2_02_FULL_51_11]
MDPMLSQALRTAYGPLVDFTKKVARNPERWSPAFTRFLRGENPWPKDADVGKEILFFQKSLYVEGQNPFVASDHFRVDMSPSAAVKISHIGEAFAEHFLPVVEEGVEPTTLVGHLVKDNSILIPRVFWELRERHEVKLANLWEALREQRNGDKDGIFNTAAARSNFLFMYGKRNVLWVISVCRNFHDGKEWVRDGWVIDALPFCRDEFPGPSDYSFRVISSVS